MRVFRVLTVAAALAVASTALVGAVPAAAGDAAPLPPITPTPQQVTPGQGTLRVPATVTVVTGTDPDPAARTAVSSVLRAAGARQVRTVASAPAGTDQLTVYLGAPAGAVLSRLGVDGPAELPSGGYVLAADRLDGHAVLALSGVDGAGTFYAAQTLRQLVRGGAVPAVTVRDWPTMPIRGTIEGFYGTPWSHADRLDQLDFYGAHKLNAYEYSPKDDPYLRDRWRDEYPDEQLAQLSELVTRAQANHVEFTYALSPGLSVCYSSADDLAKLVAKFEQVYAIGVRSFNIPLDDISYTKWNCDADAQKFGTGAAAAGAAQAYLLNAVNEAFVAKHDDVAPLQTVATEYYDVTESPYKKALREQLDPDVVVMWTGIGVIAPEITVDQARQAKQVFGHDILLWDNYPVNDYLRGRLELAPYLHRQAGLSGVLAGDTANPMNQAAASKIALYTVADFCWNDTAYDPQRSWTASIDEYAAGHRRLAAALRAFADVEYQVPKITGVQAPELAAAIKDFWTAWKANDAAGVAAFQRRVAAFAAAPGIIRDQAEPAFSAETDPWLTSMAAWGRAMTTALDLLHAVRDGDTDRAAADRATIADQVAAAQRPVDPIDGKTPVKVGDGVVDQFIDDALAYH